MRSLASTLTSRSGLAVVLVAAAASTGQISARQSATSREGMPPEVVWKIPGEGHGRPAADGDTTYFLSARHEVIAVASASGTTRWRSQTGEAGARTEGSSIVSVGSVVVAGDYNLVALDRSTGAVRWRFAPPLGFAPGIYLGEAVGTTVLAGSPAGRLYAVRASTGELAWSAAIVRDGRTTVFQPATDGTVVAAGYTTFTTPPTGGVVLLDLASGRELWRAPFPRAPDPLLGTGSAGGPLLTPTAVVASSGDGFIYAFDRADGSILWRLPPLVVPPPFRAPVPIESRAGADFRPLARAGRVLFVGSLRGRITAYDLATRREWWTHAVAGGSSVAFALVADEGAVYAPLASGRHVAIDAATGEERWRMRDPQDGFIWPALPVGRRVYLAGGKGGFVAARR